MPVKPSENLTQGCIVASSENLTEWDGGLRSEGLVVGTGSLTVHLHRPTIVDPEPSACVIFLSPHS